MTYTLHIQTASVLRDSDGKEIAPCQSTDDPDFIEYCNWIKDGNEPRVVDFIERIVPQQVTRYQARAALLQTNLLDYIDSHINSLPVDTPDPTVNLENRMIKEAWINVLHFNRNSLMVKSIGTFIGLSESQIDDLFVFASTIE